MAVTKFPKGRVLTALNAEVTTATIAITTMVIDRRQVTLSVFRQMVEEPIFDWEKMALRGVGWGYVNYMIDRHPDEAINLVFQRGNDLYRCVVQRKAPRWGIASRDDLLNRLWDYAPNAAVLNPHRKFLNTPLGRRCPAGIEDRRAFPLFTPDTLSDPVPKYIDAEDLLNGIREAAGQELPEDLARAVSENKDLIQAALVERRASPHHALFENKWRTAAGREWYARHHAQYERQEQLHKEQRQAAINAYREGVRAKYVALIDEWEQRFDEYEALVAPLFDLPHLYIAV